MNRLAKSDLCTYRRGLSTIYAFSKYINVTRVFAYYYFTLKQLLVVAMLVAVCLLKTLKKPTLVVRFSKTFAMNWDRS